MQQSLAICSRNCELARKPLTWRDVLRHVDEDDRVVQVRNMRRDLDHKAHRWEQAAGIPALAKSEEDEDDDDDEDER